MSKDFCLDCGMLLSPLINKPIKKALAFIFHYYLDKKQALILIVDEA